MSTVYPISSEGYAMVSDLDRRQQSEEEQEIQVEMARNLRHARYAGRPHHFIADLTGYCDRCGYSEACHGDGAA